MRVVVDALALRGSGSHKIVLEHLLEGWTQLDAEDDVHLVLSPDGELSVPDWVTTHVWPLRRPRMAGQVVAQSFGLRRLCRELKADALLTTLPASSMIDVGCARTAIVYDLRHELRPQQFGRGQRALRKVSYGWGYRASDSIVCISDRTRQDLWRSRPQLRAKPVTVGHLGADHVDTWPRRAHGRSESYAIAFGQYGNKNIDQVVRAWALLAEQGGGALPTLNLPTLNLLGLSGDSRTQMEELVGRLGIGAHVELLPWLSPEAFHERFASCDLVVFPSDFEGFGMPAAEAMRLGIPLVVSNDPALLEVTGGLAPVADSGSAESLAKAVAAALAQTPDELDRARRHAQVFVWRAFADTVRSAIAAAVERRARTR